MSNSCRIEGSMKLRIGVTKKSLQKALRPFFDTLEEVITISKVDDHDTEISFIGKE